MVLGELREIQGARQVTAGLLGYVGWRALFPQQVFELMPERRAHRKGEVLLQDALSESRQFRVRHLLEALFNPHPLAAGVLGNRWHAQSVEGFAQHSVRQVAKRCDGRVEQSAKR